MPTSTVLPTESTQGFVYRGFNASSGRWRDSVPLIQLLTPCHGLVGLVRCRATLEVSPTYPGMLFTHALPVCIPCAVGRLMNGATCRSGGTVGVVCGFTPSLTSSLGADSLIADQEVTDGNGDRPSCSVRDMENGGRPSLGQVILLATSSAATALFYSIYRHKYSAAQTLKGAKKISLNDDIQNLLMDLPGRCVPFAVIEGVVKSVKESLNSQFVENCKGVIQRLSLKEHKMVWNRTTHLWNDHEKVIHQRTNTVLFDLVPDDGVAAVSVRVVKPLDAAELGLETVYEKFHPAVQSFTNVLGHYIIGERPKGVQETEEMLKIGATITGIGELVLDNKIIKLQPPKAGMQYYLSNLDFEGLLKKQESQVRLWRVLSLLFGIATCVTLFFILRRQYRHHKEKQRLKKLQREFQEAKARLEEEGGVDVRNPCVICLSNEKSCVFLDCGHVCSCYDCYQALPGPKQCPICRNNISRMVPLYNS
ncbi:mitochondrial ubiquitin ligase activator of nfkb 1 [Pelobates cultripes]|uniref:RING-type E3 ubiquitin transferase n=2 Tax=Pelobates cultripes TaxID=61616 RepID=A0AAD1T362_PELCU|nr:mitochondrial ubiquitin ligase activator of nfkb 1 [Pelobates cultripes]